MIGHHTILIQPHMHKPLRQAVPYGLNDAPNVIQEHLVSHNAAQHTVVVPGANSDKIETWLAIIVAWQAERVTMVSYWINGHSLPPHFSIGIRGS